jgi:hypothetical protein
MQFLADSSYYYVRNNERQGPISGTQLVQLASMGQLQPTDLVWTEGMPAWAPANTLEGLYAAPAPVAPAGVLPPPPAPAPAAVVMPQAPVAAAPYAAAPSPVAARPLFPNAPFGGASFVMMFVLGVLGFFVLCGGIAMAVVGAQGGGNITTAAVAAGVIMGVLGFGLLVWSCVLGVIYLYRAWAAIQGHPQVESTPGKAVGFMFIPLFSLYWIFIAYGKWAKQYNEFVRINQLQGAPAVSEGLFLTMCICTAASIIPLVNYIAMLPQLVVGPIVAYQLCRAVNYLKAQSERR